MQVCDLGLDVEEKSRRTVVLLEQEQSSGFLGDERVADSAVLPRTAERFVDSGFVDSGHPLDVPLEICVGVKERSKDFFKQFAALHTVAVARGVKQAVLLDGCAGRQLERDVDALGRVDDSELFESRHCGTLCVRLFYLCAEAGVVAFTVVTIPIATPKKLPGPASTPPRAQRAHQPSTPLRRIFRPRAVKD